MILGLGPEGAPAPTLIAAGLLGLGAGATVSTGLTVASFTVAAKMVGSVFALVELVRLPADYVITPITMKTARLHSRRPPLDWLGVHHAAVVTLWIVVGFTVFGIALWIAGGAGLPKPDIKAWIGEGKLAVPSPRLLARLRRS